MIPSTGKNNRKPQSGANQLEAPENPRTPLDGTVE